MIKIKTKYKTVYINPTKINKVEFYPPQYEEKSYVIKVYMVDGFSIFYYSDKEEAENQLQYIIYEVEKTIHN